MIHGYIEAINNKNSICLLQVSLSEDETLDDIPYYQPYGLSSVPRIGSEVLIIFPDGKKESAIALSCVNRDLRPDFLKSDETALYQNKNNYQYHKTDGTSELKTKSHSVDAGNGWAGTAKKWSFSNGSYELIAVMVSLIDTLMSNTQVNTVYGNSPLLNPDPQKSFSVIKTHLESLQGKEETDENSNGAENATDN